MSSGGGPRWGTAGAMARLGFAIVIVVASFVQVALLPRINPLAIDPHLVLVMMVVWTATHGVGEGILWAAPVGVLLDVLTMETLGVNGLALLFAALLGGLARKRFFQSGILVPMVLALVVSVLSPLVVVALRLSLIHNRRSRRHNRRRSRWSPNN